MSAFKAIKSIRDELSRDVAATQKSQKAMTEELRTLAANVKAAEATLAAKVRFLASLEAIQREAEQALNTLNESAPVKVGRKPGPKAVARTGRKPGRPAKADKVATSRPDEVKVRRKPGPKSKAEKAALRAERAAKRLAAKAEKAAARLKKKVERQASKAKAVTTGAKVTKVQGARRSKSDKTRPPIKEAMALVMGNRVMSIDAILAALAAKGWSPNSKNPRTYMGYLLSSSKDRFEHVKGQGRGMYRCKGGAAVAKVEKTEAAPVSAPEVKLSADQILDEAGILGAAPFGG